MTREKVVVVAENYQHVDAWRMDEERRRGEPIRRQDVIVVIDMESAQRLRGMELRQDQVVWYSYPRQAGAIEALIRSRIRLPSE